MLGAESQSEAENVVRTTTMENNLAISSKVEDAHT